MPTRNINLTAHFDRFVEQQINAGRYSNASEVLRAGLRLLEQQTQADKEKLKVLRLLAAEGIAELDQGQGIEINSAQELKSFISQIGRRAAAKAKRKATAE